MKTPSYLFYLILCASLACISVLLANSFHNFFIQLIALGFTLYLPGYFLLKIIQPKSTDFWLMIVNSLGLSIGYIYVIGLLSSYVAPYLGVAKPLDFPALLISFFSGVLILGGIAVFRNKSSTLDFGSVKESATKIMYYLAGIGFSLISLFGAFLLNSGGSNVLSIVWILFLALTFFLVSQFQGKKSEHLNPFIIFVLSLSLLWSLSGRSWHLIGWDIVQEFNVARLTVETGKWSMDTIKDAYNACLSITILPAVTSNITHLPLEFIFKYIFPFIFAHFPVVIYYLYKQLSKAKSSMFAILYILAQPFFIQPMIALARQEIAFFIFSLLLLSIFTKKSQTKLSVFLTIFYTFVLVASHYSTSYVAIILFGLMFFVLSVLFFIKKLPLPTIFKGLVFYKNWITSYKSSFKWWMFFLLVAVTYAWYFLITQTAGNVSATIQETLRNMTKLFQGDQQSQEVRQAIPGMSSSVYTTSSDLEIFTKTYKGGNVLSNLTDQRINEIEQEYEVLPMSEELIHSSLSSSTASGFHSALENFKEILKFAVILGAFLILIQTFIKKKDDLDFVMLSSVGSLFLLVMILHPTLGLRYNISRIYLQLLVFLSLTLVLTIEEVFWFLKERLRLIILGSGILTAFCYLQGLFLPLIGGVPVLQFYNVGTDFDKFYVYQEELSAARWLQDNRNFSNTVYADDLTGLRLRKEAFFFPNTTILPLVLANNGHAYVYLSATNKLSGKAQVTFNNKSLSYTYPIKLLDNEKNLIYSSSKSVIYK